MTAMTSRSARTGLAHAQDHSVQNQGILDQAALPSYSDPEPSLGELLPATIAAIDRLPPALAALAGASQETWVSADWAEFEAIVGGCSGQDNARELPHTKAYYHQSWMKLDMVPLGKDHGRQNNAPLDVVSLYAAFHQVRLVRYINTTLRKADRQACQPDLSIYVGDIDRLPTPGNQVIDLDLYDPPNLVVEVAADSLADDLGMKRLLYENLGIREYWVVNTKARSLIAFSIADRRSGQILQSEVLSGLDLAIVEEALRRTDDNDDAATMRWLIEKFSR